MPALQKSIEYQYECRYREGGSMLLLREPCDGEGWHIQNSAVVHTATLIENRLARSRCSGPSSPRPLQKTFLGEIRVLFESGQPDPERRSNYNAAPTDILPVVRLDRDRRRSRPAPVGLDSVVGEGRQDGATLH
jgi:hypothetical protein